MINYGALEEDISIFSNQIQDFNPTKERGLVELKKYLLALKTKSDVNFYREGENFSEKIGLEPAKRFYKNVVRVYEKNEESSSEFIKRILKKKFHSWARQIFVFLPSKEAKMEKEIAEKLLEERIDVIFAPKHVLMATAIPENITEEYGAYPTTRYDNNYLLARAMFSSQKMLEEFYRLVKSPYVIKIKGDRYGI
jgi:hypothetical protein